MGKVVISGFFGRRPDLPEVCLEEDGIEVYIDDFQVIVRLTPRRKRRSDKPQRPPYGGFANELPKQLLKRFPILYSYYGDGKFEGVSIFRARPSRRPKKTPRPRS